MERIPEKLQEKVFEKLFKVAEIAKFTPEEALSYEDSLRYYRDLKNSLDTAREEDKEEGRNERNNEIIKNGIKEGLSVEVLMKLTSLSKAQIEKILDL